jgi:hypothetical protein
MGDAELPEWKVGDKWVYETPYYGVILKEKTEVINITTINVNDISYGVYVVLTNGSAPWLDTTLYSYVLINNMTTVKETGTWGYGINKTEAVIIYQPPKKELDFPLSVGKTWNSTYQRIHYDEIQGYINMTETLFYNVTGIETITVKAGTFKCYVIEEFHEWGDIHLRTWYSPKVKNAVKIEDIYRITIVTELTSYSANGKDEEVFALFTIFYIMLFIFIMIILIVLINNLVVRKKGKKTRADVTLQPASGTMPFPTKPQTDLYAWQPESSVPQYPESPGYQQGPCPTCGQSMSFIPQYNKWYCYNCEKYL